MKHEQWTEVRSGKLLRRLAAKELIAEPPPEQRPTLPSQRAWGKGYNYVVPIDGRPLLWDFEGSRYQIVKKLNHFYVWKTTSSNPGKPGRRNPSRGSHKAGI